MATTQGPQSAAEGSGQATSAATINEPSPTPLQRLARSRERLRQVLAPPPRPAADNPAGGSGKSWEQRLRDIPGIATALDVVKVWWQQHPLHAVSIVAGEVGRTTLRPVARRHPYALVGVALLAGALLAWARPWRWALRSALFAGLAPQVASRVVASLPIESWLTVLGTLFSTPPRSSRSAAAAAAAAASSTDATVPGYANGAGAAHTATTATAAH